MVMWFWKHYLVKGGWGLGSFKKTLRSCNILFPSNPWYQNVREYGHGLLSRSLWTMLIWNILTVIFPECVARVPVSLWGSGGVFARCCRTVRNRPQPSATVHNRPQPSATVRNRSRDGRMAVPMVSSAEGSLLEVSHAALLGFVWQAWHFVTFRRILRSTSDVSIVILRGKRSTWDVSCCFFFWRIAFSGLCQAATRCTFHGRRGILWDVIKSDGRLARNIDFWGSKFQVLRKTRRKTSILTWKLESRTKCWFFCSHESRLESLVFLWPRPVYGGSCKTSPVRRFPSRLSCCFAWQARRFVTFQPVW